MFEKIVRKKCEIWFLYSHENRDQKIGEENVRNNFFQKHTNSASKKCWEKSSQKSAKTRILYSQEYRDKKMGGKRRETIFPETH